MAFKLLFGRQHAARKNIFLNKIGLVAISIVAVVGDGYDLQSSFATWCQASPYLIKVRGPVFLSDCFEHFYGNDPIEMPADVAIIL